MHWTSSALLIATIPLVGCANSKYTLDAAYDASAVIRQLQPGTNAVVGSSLIRQRNGGVITCAGRPITLMPATPRARQWAETMTDDPRGGYVDLSGGGYLFPNNPELFQNALSTTCDVNGQFAFRNVGDGEWLISSRIVWQVTPFSNSGGLTIRTLAISGGRTLNVVIAP